MTSKPLAVVYFDGLNFYNQAIGQAPDAKWLNVLDFAKSLLPEHEVKFVRYFTSEVKPGLNDVESTSRQKVFLRALRTLGPTLIIHQGWMKSVNRRYPSVPQRFDEETGEIHLSTVKKTEEKGTDVLISSYMTLDASRNEAELFALISSDSDFAPLLGMLKEELSVQTAHISTNESFAKELVEATPDIQISIDLEMLREYQLPDQMSDDSGTFSKPEVW